MEEFLTGGAPTADIIEYPDGTMAVNPTVGWGKDGLVYCIRSALEVTAVHVFCRQKRSRGERLSRHWYDLVKLDDAGYAEKALAERALALFGSSPQVDVLP